MIIDDSITNLTIADEALKDSCNIIPVTSGIKAIELLGRMKELPTLILLDIEMPIMNGFEVIKKIKENKDWNYIPIIFLTSNEDTESELLGLSFGAVDYIKKPFSIPLLKKRIELHIKIYEQNKELEEYNISLEKKVADKTKTILELQSAIISTISDLIGKRDGYTGEHVMRVEKYMQILLAEIVKNISKYNFTESEMYTIAFCSKLHDVGKIGVRDSVLLKDGKLTFEEMEIIKQHTTIGSDAIENSMKLVRENQFLKYVYEMVRWHHEKWNGSGYPEGLAGNDIPFVARVMAVADVYDALTSIRPYKSSIEHKVAVKIIKEGRETHFDPEIVDIFLRIEDKFDEIREEYSLTKKVLI